MTDLSGLWSLSDESGAYRILMQVPGDVVTALHHGGEIADPYWGRNEYDLRWIADRDWTIAREFDHGGDDADLVIEGLDCVAEVRLNGRVVLQAANAFRRWRVDVTGYLRRGANRIEVQFHAPAPAAKQVQDSQPFYIPYHAGNCPIPHGNMLRKPQCDFGWDWNIALPTSGITGAVRLQAKGPRIDDIVVQQTHRDGVAEVALQVFADTDDVTATLCGITQTAQVVGGVARVVLVIPAPQLWWPVGLGQQTLHCLTVTAAGTSTTRQIGLRDMALISEKDAAGRSFGLRVNGHDVFARGANWIPADALAGRISQVATRDLLQSAVDANMNMIRVWGGGRYEPDWFYDLCDEMGLMVWQDFMFACHLYPSTPAFLAEVDAEVRDVVRRINHHACLALWCGDNELIGALTWFDESRKDRDRYLVNYDRLNRTIEAALLQTQPGANWWPSSPSPGPMAFGDAWHDDSSGDMHFWSVWHEGRDFDHYRDVRPRFCSEFGFQSYPSLDVIRRFADPADFNIAAPVMESHQKNAGGNARIAETMFRYFRFPVDFANFVYLSQVQQGVAIKTAVTAWRALKPHCMGALYWQLNDTWPVCSWSSLDHGGGWKMLHHMARHFFAPVTVVAVPVEDTLVLKGVNDTRQAAALTVTVSALNMTGVLRVLASVPCRVDTQGAAVVATVALADLRPDEVLHWAWAGDAVGDDLYAPRAWKTYDLHPAHIAQKVMQSGGLWHIDLTATALAPFVAMESDQPGRFSDNAFALIPGATRRVIFTPAQPGAAPQFMLRDLHSATTARP